MKQGTSGVENSLARNQNLTSVDVLVAAAVVAAVGVVVAAAAAVDGIGVDFETLEHFQDWMPTEAISSMDEILSRQPRPRVVAEISLSACCTALPTSRVGSRAGPGDPERTETRFSQDKLLISSLALSSETKQKGRNKIKATDFNCQSLLPPF